MPASPCCHNATREQTLVRDGATHHDHSGITIQPSLRSWSYQCGNTIAAVLFILSMITSLLVGDTPFDINAPYQGMLLPFVVTFLMYKLCTFIDISCRRLFFGYVYKGSKADLMLRPYASSTLLTIIANIALYLVWIFLLAKEHEPPPRACMASTVTFTTGCIDLWLSHHPDFNPMHAIAPYCGCIFRLFIRRPFRGLVSCLHDVEQQICICCDEQ